MSKKDSPPIHTLVCPDCGSATSGPDKKAAEDAAARHSNSAGHSAAVTPEPAAKGKAD